jgi:prophage DNA circulation protein
MADKLKEYSESIIQHEASYRGAFFYIKSSEIGGGRKDAKKEFIDSDRQIIEDLGKKQRIFTVNGCVSDRRDNTGKIITPYIQVRNALISALEKGGPGILIHPWYGKLEDIVCRKFTISEDVTKLGDCTFTATFEISNTDGIPKFNPFALTGVSTGAVTVATVAASIFSSIWEITDAATGNFQSAMDKANNFVDSVNVATNPIATLASKLDDHSSLLTSFQSNVATLVSNPAELSAGIDRIMNSVTSLYSTPEGALIAFKSLFNFGDNDISAPYPTFISAERTANNQVFNSMVQSEALSNSYLTSSQSTYKTVTEINEIEADLETQYQKLFLAENIDVELMNSLTELRTITTGFFSEQKLNVSQIITIQSNPISIRALAYSYYGDSSDGEDIAELNGLSE